MYRKDPHERKNTKRKQQIAYDYASKTKILNWHDAYAKAVFNRKPYHMIQDERLQNEEEGREKTDDCGDH